MLEPDELNTGLRVRGFVDAREVTGAQVEPRWDESIGVGSHGNDDRDGRAGQTMLRSRR